MRQTIRDIGEFYEHLPTLMGIPFAFDVETSGLKYRTDQLLGLALSFEDGRHFYIVLGHTMQTWDGSTYFERFVTDTEFYDAVRGLFAQRDVVMVAHNAKFDLHFLTRGDLTLEGKLFDTMVAAHLLDENRDLGLKELAPLVGMELTEYSQLPHYSGFKKHDILGVALPDVAHYAMDDTEATWKLYNLFRAQLAEDRMAQHAFNTVWMPALIVLQKMEARAIRIDIEQVRVLKQEYEADAAKHEAAIRKEGIEMLWQMDLDAIASYYLRTVKEEEAEGIYENIEGRLVIDIDDVTLPVVIPKGKRGQNLKPRVADFNTGSDKQLADLIFRHINVDTTKGIRLKTSEKSGEISVDKDNLETLIFYLGDNAPPVLRELLSWRKSTKFISTYLDRFLEDADPNRQWSIVTNFLITGTKTGRLSSSGPNLQNIPSRGEVGKRCRNLFLPYEGELLLVGDYGQMELRMLAHMSEDAALMKAFVEERDLHILTASGFARVPYEELKEKYDAGDRWAWEMRQLGKTGNFALTYGMGPMRFQRYLIVNNKYEVSIEQAKEWIKGYNNTYEGAKKWKEDQIKFARAHNYVETIIKRKRRLPDILSPNDKLRFYQERQAVNAVIQGSCADVMLKVMPYIQSAIAPFGGTLVLQVHDELVASAPKKYADVCAKIMQTLMTDIINPVLKVPMLAEVHIGPSWGEAKG